MRDTTCQTEEHQGETPMTRQEQVDVSGGEGGSTGERQRHWSRHAVLRLGAALAVPALAVVAGSRMIASGLAAPGRQAIETPEGEATPETGPADAAAMGAVGEEGQLPLTPSNVDEDDAQEDLS